MKELGPWSQQWEDEFLRGQGDCRHGRPHLTGQSEGYTRGYSAEYENQQVQDWVTQNVR